MALFGKNVSAGHQRPPQAGSAKTRTRICRRAAMRNLLHRDGQSRGNCRRTHNPDSLLPRIAGLVKPAGEIVGRFLDARRRQAAYSSRMQELTPMSISGTKCVVLHRRWQLLENAAQRQQKGEGQDEKEQGPDHGDPDLPLPRAGVAVEAERIFIIQHGVSDVSQPGKGPLASGRAIIPSLGSCHFRQRMQSLWRSGSGESSVPITLVCHMLLRCRLL